MPLPSPYRNQARQIRYLRCRPKDRQKLISLGRGRAKKRAPTPNNSTKGANSQQMPILLYFQTLKPGTPASRTPPPLHPNGWNQIADSRSRRSIKLKATTPAIATATRTAAMAHRWEAGRPLTPEVGRQAIGTLIISRPRRLVTDPLFAK